MKNLLALVLVLCSAAVGAAGPQASVLSSLPRHVAVGDKLHISGQPSPEAVARLPEAGISVLIDLRPDAETPGVDKKANASAAGLAYHALPIASPADLTRENVATFDRLLKESSGKGVLAHCASGNRVGAMMALRARWIEGKSAEEALAIGKAVGMTSLAEAVAEKLQP